MNGSDMRGDRLMNTIGSRNISSRLPAVHWSGPFSTTNIETALLGNIWQRLMERPCITDLKRAPRFQIGTCGNLSLRCHLSLGSIIGVSKRSCAKWLAAELVHTSPKERNDESASLHIVGSSGRLTFF